MKNDNVGCFWDRECTCSSVILSYFQNCINFKFSVQQSARYNSTQR